MDTEEQKAQAAHIDETRPSADMDGDNGAVADAEISKKLVRRIDTRVMPVVRTHYT